MSKVGDTLKSYRQDDAGRIILPASSLEHFQALIDFSGGEDACWPWKGHTDPSGYGIFRLAPGGAGVRTHRLSYAVYVGPLIEGLAIRHLRCREPDAFVKRRCCNWHHLAQGTWAENNQDKIQDGTAVVLSGGSHWTRRWSASHGRSLEDRFWEKVDMSDLDGCWPWMGATDAAGYGVFNINGKNVKAHRVAYMLDGGTLRDGERVRHVECDNPPCCRPDHLAPGTARDNVDDMMRKRRNRPLVGEDNHFATLNAAAAAAILREYLAGSSCRRLGHKYGVTPGHIEHILVGRAWGHLPLEDLRQEARAKLDASRRGAGHSPYGLKDEDIYAMFDLYRSGQTLEVIARRFGLSFRHVSSILRRKTWQHLPIAAIHPDRSKSGENHWTKLEPGKVKAAVRRGEAHDWSRLKEEDIREIVRRYNAGETARELGEAFGIGHCYVRDILNRKVWSHLELVVIKRNDKNEMSQEEEARLLTLLKQGVNQRQIAKTLGRSPATVCRHVKELQTSGHIGAVQDGRRKR